MSIERTKAKPSYSPLISNEIYLCIQRSLFSDTSSSASVTVRSDTFRHTDTDAQYPPLQHSETDMCLDTEGRPPSTVQSTRSSLVRKQTMVVKQETYVRTKRYTPN